MTVLDSFKQQPDEVLDYDIDFSEFLPKTDSIVSASLNVFGGSLGTSFAIAPKRVKVWCYDGVNGVRYKISVTVETEEFRVKQVEFNLLIKDD